MKAMLLARIGRLQEAPLVPSNLPDPVPAAGELLLKVLACGVCHTELDEIEGRTPPPKLPVIPGHQVVGRVVALGTTDLGHDPESQKGDSPRRSKRRNPVQSPRFRSCPASQRFRVGERVGVAWIFSVCGRCEYCRSGQENLCPEFRATGRDANGGYAEYMTVPEGFAFSIPEVFADAEAAPLLCAGAVGYRSLRLTGIKDGQNLGLTGFGASGHLVLKMVRRQYPKTHVYVFARSKEEQAFARELGATWAGDTDDQAPELLDSIIDTTPVWKPVVAALGNLKPGGRLVINAIRKEETDKAALLGLDYAKHLWMEKEIKSVANVTRQDVAEFLELAARIPIKPEIQEYALEDANQALLELKERRIRGAKVLLMA
ncbi:MAG: zinc-dependent alcohol dehydrogenase family protein [candidate division WOR-3 bacterium]|nr:zinc-dependent alcohol dehydrogenase family protein [candidate division WOR-3 bacterium]